MTAYATVDQFKDENEITATDQDAHIQRLLDGATEMVNRFVNRKVPIVAAATATAKLFPVSGTEVLFIPECVEITKLETRESLTDPWITITPGNYIVFRGEWERQPVFEIPYSTLALTNGGVFTRSPHPLVQVTAKWGLSVDVPGDIRKAVIITAHRWYKRGQASWADTAGSSDFGLLMVRQSLDPDVRQILVGGRWVNPTL